MEIEVKLNSILREAGIISDESKEKICIITDIVAMGKLIKMPIPNWCEFCELYDADLKDLEQMQYEIMRNISHLPGMEELKKRIIMGWDGTHTEF